MVADRLRVFCDIGVLQAAAHPRRADWAEYRLTPKGLAFFPVVATAIHWGESHLGTPNAPALTLTHTKCARPFIPELACDQCGQALAGSAVEVVAPA